MGGAVIAAAAVHRHLDPDAAARLRAAAAVHLGGDRACCWCSSSSTSRTGPTSSWQRFFMVIMFANIVLVLAITVHRGEAAPLLGGADGYLGITFLTQGGYPAQLPLTDALALFNQPGGSLMWVSFWVVAAGFGMGRYAGQVTGVLRPPENDHRRGAALGHERPRGAPQDEPVGQARRLQPDPLVGDHRRPHHDLPLLGGRATPTCTTTSSRRARSRRASRSRCRWPPSPGACWDRWPGG